MFTQAHATINESYDRELILELVEKFQTHCKLSEHTHTFYQQFDKVLRVVMGFQLMCWGGNPWAPGLRLYPNTLISKFLLANFPKEHRVWNYVTVANRALRLGLGQRAQLPIAQSE